MKTRSLLFAGIVASLFSSAQAETIAPGATYSQNFNGIGTSATASLPSGWTVINSSSARSVTKDLYDNAGSATAQEGTGTGTSNGIYNWGDAGASSDRAVGFLASNSATKTGNLYLTLTASGSIPDFTISYDMKCYRNNTRAFQFQLYYSTDSGATWTSAGSSFCTTNATGTSGVVNPAGVTSVSSQTLNVSRSSGETIVFCWSYSVPSGTTTSNAQGLGIDNVVIVAGQSSTSITPLPAPANVVASNESYSSFTLSWGSVSGATGYNVSVQNAHGATVFTAQTSFSQTTVSVTGLAPGGVYAANVVAIGDGTTNDNSAPGTCTDISTLASVVLPSPTNLHTTNIEFYEASVTWDPVSDAEGYTVTVSPSSGVTVSDNGTTADLSGLEEGATYTVSVVAKGTGIETVDSPAATLDVTTAVAPAIVAPELSAASVSASSVTIQWPAQASASFSVRAWTLLPLDTVTENFATYAENGTVPAGWTFVGLSHDDRYEDEPVAFEKSKDTAMSMESCAFDADITSVSFRLRANSASSSTLDLSGSSDGNQWIQIASWTGDALKGTGVQKTAAVETSGIRRLKWTFQKDSGNIFIGAVVVQGTNIANEPSYLTGYGPDATAVAGTSVTISNPVAGETNYIEVTATGLSGKTATATLPVAVPAPRAPATVISVW